MSGVILTPGIDSPCIAQCTTALGDNVCRGCGRTFEEVTYWNLYSDQQRQVIMQRLATQRQSTPQS